MVASLPPELAALVEALRANGRAADRLAVELDEPRGTWRPAPGAWSVAECLDHLATSNRVYLLPIAEAAAAGRARGRFRRGPATPGLVGRWFVRSLEPPVKKGFRGRAPQVTVPRPSPPLADAAEAFRASQQDVERFILENADLDLARIHFVNPFVRGVRFSLATGLHVIPAHERRHLWQAARVVEKLG